MTTTTLRAALARLQQIDWAAIGHRIDTGIRYVTITAQLLLAAVAIAWQIAYEHRREIRDALVLAAAHLVVAAERTYRAGRWTRRLVDRMGQLGAVAMQLEPREALTAAREALERLVRRLYPVAA